MSRRARRGSLILANLEDAATDTMATSGALTRGGTIDQVDGRSYLVIYQR